MFKSSNFQRFNVYFMTAFVEVTELNDNLLVAFEEMLDCICFCTYDIYVVLKLFESYFAERRTV